MVVPREGHEDVGEDEHGGVEEKMGEFHICLFQAVPVLLLVIVSAKRFFMWAIASEILGDGFSGSSRSSFSGLGPMALESAAR